MSIAPITTGIEFTLRPTDAYGELIEDYIGEEIPKGYIVNASDDKIKKDNLEVARKAINTFLQNNNCKFYDEISEKCVEVRMRYCRTHEELYLND
jgi:hypothetical protein